MGTVEDSALEAALLSFVTAEQPEVVVASGDLTHRGRAAQHETAARFLRGLGRPLVVVPGNHDIPYDASRFTRTFARFEAHWGTTEPVYRSDALHIVGINSVRSWPSQAGAVSRRQLGRVADALVDAAPGALKTVVLHHHLIAAPWRTGKLPVLRRNRVLGALVDAGAELILAGHVHQAAVSERREFEIVSGDDHGVVVSTAPGLGQPRPRRRGEARGLHLYEIEPDGVAIATYIWRLDGWGLVARRRFARSPA